MLTLIIAFLLVASLKMVRYYRSRELTIIQGLQKRQEYLSEISSQCFHETLNHEERILEPLKSHEGKELQDTIKKTTQRCKVGFIARSGLCVPCPQGTFALEQWITCVSLLSCAEISDGVQIGTVLYTVGSWTFYAARWNNYDITYALLIKSDDSQLVNVSDIQKLMPCDNLLYLIGQCDREESAQRLFARNREILGCADELDSILAQKTNCDYEIIRFRLAMDYVQTLALLHSNKTETLVLCNSHSLSLLLSQFLITEDFRLVLAAYDNLPVLNASSKSSEAKVKCSQKELKGDFVAPEQKWPYQSSKVFNYVQQAGYTEKADIWKIPDVAQALLNKKGDYQNILDLLEVMHRKCKNLEPSSRPTAAQVLHKYQFIWKTLGFGKIFDLVSS
jgi:glycoprotein-mannosyl O6-kinase